MLVVLALALAPGDARLLAQGSGAAQEHADKALEFAHRGDLKSAESELRKAVELSPRDADLLTSLGGILGMEGNLREANTYLARAVQANPQDAAARRNLAANEWQLGRLKEAHANLDLLLRANPRDKLAIYLLGMVAEKEKAYARSIKLLESVPDVTAQQPESCVALASGYYHTGRAENARAALQHLLSAPSNPHTAFLGGRVAEDAQDYPMAESLFRSVRATYPDHAAVEFEIALVEYRAGHETESEKTLLEAGNANQLTKEGYVLLCTMLTEGSDLRALQAATRGVNAFPDFTELLDVKGSIELRLRYYNDAAASYGKSAALKETAGAMRGLGVAQWKTGFHERAAKTFERAMRQFPRDAQSYEAYGTLLLEDGAPENKPRAIDLLHRALALNDSAVEARYQLANVELESGNAQQALEYLEKAVQLAPKDSRVHFALSRAYRRLNRGADAGKETEIYQKLKAAEQHEAANGPAGGTQQ